MGKIFLFFKEDGWCRRESAKVTVIENQELFPYSVIAVKG